MNKYVRQFLHRGLLFGGFGPIVVSIVFVIIESAANTITLNAKQILIAVLSSYVLAFVQAGATGFEQIDHWSTPKSVFFHFLSLYIVYIGTYLINSWIPFSKSVVLIFTGIFIAGYALIWLIIYFVERSKAEKLNMLLKGE
mgnify:CR=1 FL=1